MRRPSGQAALRAPLSQSPAARILRDSTKSPWSGLSIFQTVVASTGPVLLGAFISRVQADARQSSPSYRPMRWPVESHASRAQPLSGVPFVLCQPTIGQ